MRADASSVSLRTRGPVRTRTGLGASRPEPCALVPLTGYKAIRPCESGNEGFVRARPSYGGYAGIMSAFVGGLTVTGLLAARLRRSSSERTALDLAVLGLASFEAARTLAHDEVTSFIREPFVEGTPSDASDEHAVETGGIRQAVGELVTCSRCIGTWVAAALAALEVLAPPIRAHAHLVARGRRRQRLAAGRVQCPHRCRQHERGQPSARRSRLSNDVHKSSRGKRRN